MDRRMVRPVIIGVDCGVGGGIAYKTPRGVKAITMPRTINKITDAFIKFKDCYTIVYVEDVPPFVGVNRPAARIFKLAKNYGIILGILEAFNMEYKLVRPAKWMADIGTNKKKHYKTDNEWKNYLKELAKIYWPNTKVTLKTADALLILQYGLRQQLDSEACDE